MELILLLEKLYSEKKKIMKSQSLTDNHNNFYTLTCGIFDGSILKKINSFSTGY